MKMMKYLILALAFVFGLTFAGSGLNSNGSLSTNAQDTMLGKVGDVVQKKTVKGAKATARTTRRVGTTVGNKTWTGTKWVASKSWKGGKWIAVKTKKGTKWVYVKGKNTVKGAVKGSKKPVP